MGSWGNEPVIGGHETLLGKYSSRYPAPHSQLSLCTWRTPPVNGPFGLTWNRINCRPVPPPSQRPTNSFFTNIEANLGYVSLPWKTNHLIRRHEDHTETYQYKIGEAFGKDTFYIFSIGCLFHFLTWMIISPVVIIYVPSPVHLLTNDLVQSR